MTAERGGALLVNVDSVIPNLALMHISSWRKSEGKINTRLYITTGDRAYWQRIVDIIEDDETAMDVVADVIDITIDMPDNVKVTLQTW